MKTYEATGKTYEEALENGLSALGMTISDVDITVLEEGSKGLFGLFGSRPYKLRLTVKAVEEDPLADLFSAPKPEKKPERKPTPKPVERKAEPKAEKKPEPKAEPAAEVKAEKPAQPKPVQRKAKPVQPKAEEKPVEAVENTEAAASAEETEETVVKTEKKRSRSRSRRRGEKKHTDATAVETAEKTEASRPLPPKEIKPIEKPVVTMIPDEEVVADSAAGKAQAFLKELTTLMGVNVEVAVGTDTENNVFVQMTGDTLGILIGRRGETLDAIQYLTSLKVNRGQDDYTRVTIDTENYRAKREDTLIRLANRMANRAVKTGRKVSLEPMNPYERRVIHSALQANEAVDTHSEGEEPRRHVVITLRK